MWKHFVDASNPVWSSFSTTLGSYIIFSFKLLLWCNFLFLFREFFPISLPSSSGLKERTWSAGLQMTLECCAYFHSRKLQPLHQISLKLTGLLIGKAKSQTEGKGYVTNISVSMVKALFLVENSVCPRLKSVPIFWIYITSSQLILRGKGQLDFIAQQLIGFYRIW